MCEKEVAHRSVSVLVGESRSPPVEEEGHKEYFRVFFEEDRGEVSRQGEGQAKSLDLPQQE